MPSSRAVFLLTLPVAPARDSARPWSKPYATVPTNRIRLRVSPAVSSIRHGARLAKCGVRVAETGASKAGPCSDVRTFKSEGARPDTSLSSASLLGQRDVVLGLAVLDGVVEVGDEEPVEAAASGDDVGRVVAEDLLLVQVMGCSATLVASHEVRYPLLERDVRAGPLGNEGVEGCGDQVVGGRAGDQDVVAAPAGDRVGPPPPMRMFRPVPPINALGWALPTIRSLPRLPVTFWMLAIPWPTAVAVPERRLTFRSPTNAE